MALPTSATWDLVDFNPSTMSSFLGLGPSDISLLPSGPPYFTYVPNTNVLRVQSNDDVAAIADFNVGVPARFTVDFEARFPRLPYAVGDIAQNHIGIQIADDAGRGIAIYFSQVGIAFGRIDDFGSISVVPDSADITAQAVRDFHKIRVAVDSGLGRAYIYMGKVGVQAFPPLRFILPVEPTPSGVSDRFRLVVRGNQVQSPMVEYRTLQLAGDLLIPNIPPTANAGADRVITEGNTVRFDGRASFDPEGAVLQYRWKAVDAPSNSSFVFENSNGNTTDDGDSDGVTDTLSFPPNALPAWVQAGDILRFVGERYEISGVDNTLGTLTITTDALPDSITGTPFRVIRQSLLVGADSETPYAVPDVPGIYRVELTVNDGEIWSEPSEALVNVVGARAPLGIEPEVEVIWDALGDEWGLVEGRGIFTELWRGTSQILGAKLLEAWQHHYNTSIKDAQPTFQRKWLAFPTLIAETDPYAASISPRYGKVESTYDFNLGNPVIMGAEFVVELPTPAGFEQYPIAITGNSLAQIVADCNAAFSSAGLDIQAYGITYADATVFGMTSTTTPFRLGAASTAALVLGMPTLTYNYLQGSRGARVTDDTYRVDLGIDLVAHGVQKGDLLVLNGGQSFRIDRVLNDPRDPYPNMRLLLRDPLPFDATETWEIPGVVKSAAVDYEYEGSYPGDLVKVEARELTNNTYSDHNGTVVGQFGMTVGARLDGLYGILRYNTYELRLLGIKRRKGVRLPEDVLSIPRLQDLIPQSMSPRMWFENSDYFLEPYFRDDLEAPIPMLQFRDSVFVDTNQEPPDVFWAELVVFSNDQNIEDLFGRATGFMREDAKGLGPGFSYLGGVSGLLYSQQKGPTPSSIRIGAQILFGQPFAETKGTITEIRDDYSTTATRILIRDDDGNTPSRSEVVRTYVIKKDPRDLTATSGIETNPATGVPYAVGDTVAQFAPLGTGVDITDYINDPKWFVPYVRSGVISELEKFFYFLVTFDLDIVTLANISLISQFVYRMKPTYTHPLLVGRKLVDDDIDPVDVLGAQIRFWQYDTVCGLGRANMYDDYRGDGTFWTHYDGNSDPDGPAYYDGFVDCPEDWIRFCLVLDWPGGPITYDSVFFLDTDVRDITGAYTGTPGTMFTPTHDLSLPAGQYEVCVVIDPGNQVLP